MRPLLIALLMAATTLAPAQVEPTPLRDYTPLLDATATLVPVDQRAWPLYRNAIIRHLDDAGFPGWLGRSHRPDLWSVTPQQLEQMTRDTEYDPASNQLQETEDLHTPILWLAKHQDLLDDLASASKRPGFGWVASEWLDADRAHEAWGLKNDGNVRIDGPLGVVHYVIPHIWQLRGVAQAAQMDFELAYALNESGRITRDLDIMYACARYADETPLLIAQLVALACQHAADKAFEYRLRDKPGVWSDERLRLESERLSTGPDWDVLEIHAEGTRAYVLDVFQRLYADAGGGPLTAKGISRFARYMGLDQNLSEEEAVAFLDSYLGDRRSMAHAEDQAVFEALHDEFLKQLQTPFWQRDSSEIDRIERESSGEQTGKCAIITSCLLPAYANILKAQTRAVATRRRLLVYLAIDRHRMRHAAWPVSIDVIDHDLLQGIGHDVLVDPNSGVQHCYEITEHGPALHSNR